MSSKLTLHDHRNLIYYPLTCCHSICSFRYPVIHISTFQSRSSGYYVCVLGLEFYRYTTVNSDHLLSNNNSNWALMLLLENAFFKQENIVFLKLISKIRRNCVHIVMRLFQASRIVPTLLSMRSFQRSPPGQEAFLILVEGNELC